MKSKTKFHLILWAGMIGLVIIIGVIFFPREYQGLSFWESLYSTLRLFVFERDLDPFPTTRPLILIYFLAPLIALSALGTVITYLLRFSPGLRTRWMSGHVVICGAGRTGKLIAETLVENGASVVGVDVGPAEDFDEWCREKRVRMIFGDFHSCTLLQKAGAAKARSIVFASGDDLANLEGAVAAYEWLRGRGGRLPLILTHIANERLAQTAAAALSADGRSGIRFFDTYQIAADKMIAKHFNRELRAGISDVTILGFGKFGRDLFEVLIKDLGPDERFLISVVDVSDRGNAVLKLADDLGVADRVSFEQADVHDLDLVDEADKAFFLCTDDDLGNLTGAMMLAGKKGATHIYVRMATWPIAAVAEHLGEDRGVVFVNINDLVTRGIKSLPGMLSRE